MTTRRARLFLLILLIPLLLLVVSVASSLWLLQTEAGARLLAAQARSVLGEQLEWQDISGSLSGPLVMRGLELSQPGLRLQIHSITLDWSPAALIDKRVLVDSLAVQGVRLTLSESGDPPSDEPFDPSIAQLPVAVSLHRVQLRDIQVSQAGQAPVQVDTADIDASLDNGSLTLRKLVAKSPQGRISVSGSALFSREIALDLDYQLRAPELISSEGSLGFTGTPDAYQLALTAALEGADIPASHWQLQGAGNLEQLSLDQLQGQLLGGKLHARGNVGWNPLVRWDLQIDGDGLDPGQLAPDIQGELSLNMTSSGHLDAAGEIQASAIVQQLSGKLLEYPLDLSGQLAVAGENLQVNRLDLASDDNRITVRGTASAVALALDWELHAPQPEAFIPGASGQLTASGHLAGSPEAPLLQLQLQGVDLKLDTLNIPRLQLELVAGPGQEDPLKLSLASGPLLDGQGPLLESLQIQADGTTSRHTIRLATDTATEQLQAQLLGGLLPELNQWQGQLDALDLKTLDFGDWRLLQPADLHLAATGASLGESCLGETNGARLCSSGQWQQDGGGTLSATVRSLSVSQWLAAVTGEASADLDATLAADGSLAMQSVILLSEGLITVELDQQTKLLHHGGGKIDAIIDSRGFKADASFRAPEQGEVNAQLSLPQLKTFPLAEQQPLTGKLQASLPSLEGLAAWIPQLSSSGGRLVADLALSGNLEEPKVLGQLLLSEGAAEIPVAGLKLQQIELTALSDKNHPDTLLVTGGMRSGGGHIGIDGQANLADASLALSLQGDRFQVFNTPDARVRLSPELQVGWAESTLKLRGDLHVPEAQLTPRLALSPGSAGGTKQAPVPGQAIAPSPDVVIVNGPVELDTGPDLPEAPFSIDSQIRLLLGDKVDVKALGLISGISGAVTFTNTPGQVDLIPIASGSFNLDHGTFRAFSQDLDIETGQIIFADVRATEPELNIRAVRWIDNDPEVTAAGVLVTGSLTQPALDLFSRPQLEPSEVQTYLLTGRPSGSRDNVLSIGTYISPRVHVSYGYNMLERTSEFKSLFSITPRWGVGANLGEADSNVSATFTYEH